MIIVKLSYGGRSADVGWYGGSSESSIRKSIGAAFGFPAEGIILTDSEGNAVPLSNAAMPPAATVSVVQGGAVQVPLPSESMMKRLHTASGSTFDFSDLIGRTMTSDLPDDPAFQGQYVKLERVLSHLANERTWLAWLRAALTLLATAFTIWQLHGTVNKRSHPVVRSALHWLGIGFIVVVPLTAIIGWVRYKRTKYILGLSSVSIHDFFGSIGVTVQAWLLGVVLALTVGSYWSMGDYYIFGR